MNNCPSFWGRIESMKTHDSHGEVRTFHASVMHQCSLEDRHDSNHECSCGALLGRLPEPQDLMKFEIGQRVRIVAGWFPNLVGKVRIVEDCWSTNMSKGRVIESYRLAECPEATFMGTELEAAEAMEVTE